LPPIVLDNLFGFLAYFFTELHGKNKLWFGKAFKNLFCGVTAKRYKIMDGRASGTRQSRGAISTTNVSYFISRSLRTCLPVGNYSHENGLDRMFL